MERVGLEARARMAGAGLSEGLIDWGRRPLPAPGSVITARDQRLLAALHDYGYLTSAMCALLFWGRETYAARRRLKLLHDVGLVDRLRPRSIYHGGGEWIYRLSRAGWRVLLDCDMTADGEDYTPAEITSIAYLEHDLQVNALMCDVALQAAEHAGTRDPQRGLLDCLPFTWQGPRSATIDPRTEQRPAGVQLQPGGFYSAGRGIPGVLRPDATLIHNTRSHRHGAVMIEYDRTRRASKQRERLRRYDHFLCQGWRSSRYAAFGGNPLLIVVCSTDAQLPTFLRAIDEEVRGWRADASAAPAHLRTYPGRGGIGLTSRQRLLAGDTHVLAPSPLPPDQREDVGRRLAAEEGEFSLHQFFTAVPVGSGH